MEGREDDEEVGQHPQKTMKDRCKTSTDKEGEDGKEGPEKGGARNKEYDTESRWGGGQKNGEEGCQCLEKVKVKDK